MTELDRLKAASKFTTNVHVPGRVNGAQHRVRLTVDAAGVLVWAEHYVDGALKGCGPSVIMLPAGVREHVQSRLDYAPPDFYPLYWRALLDAAVEAADAYDAARIKAAGSLQSSDGEAGE